MQLRELGFDFLAYLIKFVSRVMLVDVICRFGQLRGRIGFFGYQHAILHIAVGRHEDE